VISIYALRRLILNDLDIRQYVLEDESEKPNPFSYKYESLLLQYSLDKDKSTVIMNEFTTNFPKFKSFEEIKDRRNIFANLVIADESEYKNELLSNICKEIEGLSDNDENSKTKLDKIIELINYAIFECLKIESEGEKTRPQMINLVSKLSNLDYEQSAQYLQSWLFSRSSFSFSRDLKVGDNIVQLIRLQKQNGLIKELDRKYNLHDFARYPAPILETLPDKYNESKPYVLSVFPKDDHNGIEYRNLGGSLQLPIDTLGENGNLLIMEASSYFDIIRFIKTRIDEGFKPPDVIIINAHGNENGFMLSDKKNSGEFTKKSLEQSKIRPFIDYIKNMGTEIILNSCSNGKGVDSIHEKASEMSISVISANDTISSGTTIDLEFDENLHKIRTKSVQYVNADANYYKGHGLNNDL
jgi:hypothetical protein